MVISIRKLHSFNIFIYINLFIQIISSLNTRIYSLDQRMHKSWAIFAHSPSKRLAPGRAPYIKQTESHAFTGGESEYIYIYIYIYTHKQTWAQIHSTEKNTYTLILIFWFPQKKILWHLDCAHSNPRYLNPGNTRSPSQF